MNIVHSLVEFRNPVNNRCEWTFEENKMFENVIADFNPPGSPAFFEYVAEVLMPWKSIESIKLHYQNLVDDIKVIESDLFGTLIDHEQEEKVADDENGLSLPSQAAATSKRRKRTVWTVEEHKYVPFLQILFILDVLVSLHVQGGDGHDNNFRM